MPEDIETTTEAAAPEASAPIVVSINGKPYTLIDEVIPARKLRNGTERPAQLVLIPQVTSLALAVALLGDVLAAAEAEKPGGAAKLTREFLIDRAKEATAVAVDQKTGELENAKYAAKLTSSASERGDSLKALQERSNKLVHESLAVMKILIAIGTAQKSDPGFVPDWDDINAKLGTRFSEEEQLALHMAQLDQSREDVEALIAKKEAAAEKAAETREKKKKAAPAPAAAPTGTPVEENVAH